jgi:hypothetical protein
MLITEKRIYRVEPIALTSDGTVQGQFTIPDSSIFRVGQIIRLKSNTQDYLEVKVKRIHPTDGVTVFVGPVGKHISKRTDISAYTTADAATVEANEQERPSVGQQEIERFTYEEEPVVARRTILVDKYGCRIDDSNPLPITGSITVGDPAGTPTIFNVDALVNGTEYSQLLPDGTTRFTIKARNNAKLQMSFVSGQSGTTFLTVLPGTIYPVDLVLLNGKSIYFQATKDNTVVEIVTWN